MEFKRYIQQCIKLIAKAVASSTIADFFSNFGLILKVFIIFTATKFILSVVGNPPTEKIPLNIFANVGRKEQKKRKK